MTLPAELYQYVLEQTVRIQQIPAPTLAESARAEAVRQEFLKNGVVDLQLDEVGNVIARVPGSGGARPLVISAHLDTVHPGGELSLMQEADRLVGPGIGDNSVGVAALLGLARHYCERGSLRGDLYLAANVCEEGLGNLRGMKSVVSRFTNLPQAYIVLEGMGLGLIYHRALGVSRYRITVETSGGHSWGDHGLPSAIHELAEIIHQINRVSLPKRPRSTLNVGKIQGGTSVNTIASRATAELDIRSEDFSTLKRIVARIQQRIRSCERPGVLVHVQEVGDRPAGEISADHALVKTAQACLHALGITPVLEIGSTDANVPLSMGLPAICIGLTRGSNAHTTEEYILTGPLKTGLQQVICLIEQIVKPA